MARRHVAKNLLAERRPFDAEFQAPRFRAAKRRTQAGAMIVIAGRKDRRFVPKHGVDVMLFRWHGNRLLRRGRMPLAFLIACYI
jgi:hypothetical protein